MAMGGVLRVIEGRPRTSAASRCARAAGGRVADVGPFIFFDHMGRPLRARRRRDVRPHPHIGWRPSPTCSRASSCIATAWARSRGSARRRELDGGGRGIAHSERTPPELRQAPGGAVTHGSRPGSPSRGRTRRQRRPSSITRPRRCPRSASRASHAPDRGRGVRGARAGLGVLTDVLPRGRVRGRRRGGPADALQSARPTWSTGRSKFRASGVRQGRWSCSSFGAGRPARAHARPVMLLGGAPLDRSPALW